MSQTAAKKAIDTTWPTGGHYSQAISAGGCVYIAGQTASTDAAELESLDVVAQTAACIQRIAAILESVGGSLSDVVKTTCFLADITDFATFNATYKEFFTTTPPARSTVQVGAFPNGILVEIEAVAVLNN